MLKWMIGKRVRAVLDLSALGVKKGDMGTVVEIDAADPGMPYRVRFSFGDHWMAPTWMEDA